ncbi:hypothetical protein [Mycobacterium sp.]|uniref:hypothetical protein n=1 Tax=Mycobacterium sp. TaxID=1785 RepID=UPI003A846FB0
MTETAATILIERYLRTRGRRYFRGRHDGEFFFVLSSGRGLHVHLENPPANPEVVTVRVTPAAFFPATERPRLTRLTDHWNEHNHSIAAAVHESSDPSRVGVAAEQSMRLVTAADTGEAAAFADDFAAFAEDFAAFADRAITAAVDLFDTLSAPGEVPLPPLLLDAG